MKWRRSEHPLHRVTGLLLKGSKIIQIRSNSDINHELPTVYCLKRYRKFTVTKHHKINGKSSIKRRVFSRLAARVAVKRRHYILSWTGL